MEKYESKQVQILRPAEVLFTMLSDFSNFTPVLKDRVEDWQATGDSCSFKIKGFTARLRIIEREPFTLIKITGDDGSPFEFYFWVQMKELAENDTRLRLVLHVKLNMMMKMMVGGKIKDGLDQMAQTIADGINSMGPIKS